MQFSSDAPMAQTLEIGFMLPNRSAGAGGFGKSGISLSLSLEPYLFLFAFRPSFPVLSPILAWPQKHENSVPIPANRLASKPPFSILYSPSYARFGQPTIGLNSICAIKEGTPLDYNFRPHTERDSSRCSFPRCSHGRETLEIGFMLPNRSAGAGGLEKSAISLSLSLSHFLSISFLLLLFEIV